MDFTCSHRTPVYKPRSIGSCKPILPIKEFDDRNRPDQNTHMDRKLFDVVHIVSQDFGQYPLGAWVVDTHQSVSGAETVVRDLMHSRFMQHGNRFEIRERELK